ncbi:MAG: NAD(P)/FAD-dependent oxidoreductase [Victivallales bacterium]|jgi:glycerol-3-phosphate dehydrogenase|nr:NAD(P)/FAD-dependent oxidoreductase [Victivallales bacterium]
MYDVVIVGAGVSGASTAWQLSRYDLKIALIERWADVGFGVSKANSGIIHGGFHHSAKKTLKAKLEILGNLMFDQLQYELDFPFQRNGILVVAFTEEQMSTVRKLYKQGLDNGVRNLEMCGRDRLLQLEPKLNPEVVGGFHAPGGGTIEPYRYVFSLVESAQKNGCELFCNFEVISGEYRNNLWTLTADDGRKIKARFVVNAAGLFADRVSAVCGAEKFAIHARKGEEYLLDRNSKARPQKVIFPVPSRESKGILVIPTAEGTTMIGPTADPTEDKLDTTTSADHMQHIVTLVSRMINGISPRDIITSFAGLRPVLEDEDFYIDLSKQVPHFVQVAGIQSPGLTASPAIGGYVKDLLKQDGLELTEKEHIAYRNLPRHEFRHETPEALDELHAQNPTYTHLVCRCEKISAAEIIEAVRKGHTTLDGVKFYTRAGMGCCQGGFCSAKIMKIISRESGIPMEELTKKGGGSLLLGGKLGILTVNTTRETAK